MPLENDTDYYATDSVYHIFPEDTVTVSDARYVALRANDCAEFPVFLFIKNKKNITIDFGGATLVMHGIIQPFLIDMSENISIRNCKVTFDRPMYTEGTIVEATHAYIKLQLNENCPCRVDGDRLIPYSSTWEGTKLNRNGYFFQVFDPETRKGCGLHLGVIGTPFIMDYDRPDAIDHYTAKWEDGLLRLDGTFPTFYRTGRILTIEHEPRALSNVFMIDCKNIHLQNYRILSGCGMGIYSYRTEDIVLDGLQLTYDAESPCLVANPADAVHAFGTSGTFEIKNSIFEGMLDDAINIHGNFRTVDHVCGNAIYTVNASCEKQADQLYRTGDIIAVYRGSTMEEQARYTILDITQVNENIRKFTVDRSALPHNKGDLIESLTANCDVTIENCVFAKANSHLRLQSRGKFVIRNCASELEILLSGDASYWFESGPVTDLTIENCRFTTDHAKINIRSEVFATEKAPYYHRNIKILNNSFETSYPLEGGYADGIVFKRNQNALGKPMILSLTNCGAAEFDNCTVQRFWEEKTQLNPN